MTLSSGCRLEWGWLLESETGAKCATPRHAIRLVDSLSELTRPRLDFGRQEWDSGNDSFEPGVLPFTASCLWSSSSASPNEYRAGSNHNCPSDARTN